MDNSLINVLLIEDNPVDETIFRVYFRKSPDVRIEVEHCGDLATGLEQLREGVYDVVVLDLSLPDSWGLDTLRHVLETRRDVPVIVLTGSEEIEQALQAVREGASDYLFKGRIDGDTLVRSVRYAVERGVRKRMEESAQASRREMEIARRIQQSLHPTAAPDVPGYDIAGTSRMAADVGGDYYDFFLLPDDSIGIAIADAMGHGVGPALLAAQTRAALRALAPNSNRVEELLVATDHVIRSPTDEVHMITLMLARLVPETGEFVHASAGHEPGLILNQQGEVRMQLDSTTYPLGSQLNGDHHGYMETRLVPGDTVVLLTDGIREASVRQNVVFGREQIVDLVRRRLREPARQIADSLIDAAWQHCHPHPPPDDLTAIVIKMSPDFEAMP